MTKRIDWEHTWMAIAGVMSCRSECTLAQVGAVIVNDKNRIIATGYNGPPANRPDRESCEGSCPRSHGITSPGYGFGCISIHAEANALLFVDRSEIEGGRMYVTSVPCEDCAKLIANSGLRWLHYIDDSKPHRQASIIMSYLLTHGVVSSEII